MPHKFSQQQKMLQKMALTPQMRQSIQLLGMSTSDLSEYIEFALSKNPFLKKVLDSVKNDHKKIGRGSTANDAAGDQMSRLKEKVDPRQYLLSQIRMTGLEDKDLEIAEYLIYELDDNGYITADPEDIAQDLSVEPEDVLKCLEVLQTMGPPGIGAQDVRECLLLQLKRAGKESSLDYKIVSSYLADVARDDIKKISEALQADAEKVRWAIINIRKLNPRPASTMMAKETNDIMPELVATIDKNKIRLEVNSGSLPQLKIYNPYESELDIVKDPEAREFLKENMDRAKGLLDNLKRREDTLCKVADHILNIQKESICSGKAELKTLTITEVAKALDFHPSTISRAVSNKYIQINDKVVPMADLLSHGITKDSGEVTSKTAVKQVIKALVKGEDASCPLSDKRIMDLLKKEGINIERRTVAKYRQSLKILPTYLRKKVS